MFNFNDPFLNQLAHNIVNAKLYPERIYRLAQTNSYSFRDAKIVLERIGNSHGLGKDPLSYRIDIDGHSFTLGLIAVWDDVDEATADVSIVSATPFDEDGRADIVAWLEGAVNAKTPPRDNYTGF